ncbi:MAG TPA: hypothetical protein VMP89_05900 [Solirubrobacteraceae bacterium]|nr:hypothetical protein [Solirubrobacteraceae bacterium]
MTRLAALDGEGFYVEGARPVTHSMVSASRIFDALDERNIDVCYVHASALERMGLPVELEPLRDRERPPPHEWLAGAGSRPSLAPSLARGERELLVGAWQDGAGDPFAEAADGAELLAAVVAFRDAFKTAKRPEGWAFMHTAAGTGWNLMHYPWSYGRRARNLGEQLLAPEADMLGSSLRWSSDRGQVEVPYGGKWWRLNPHEAHDLKWTHAYDVNGQRLAACSRLRLGVGEPRQLARGSSRIAAIEEGFPGYHLVSHIEHPWGERIPAIFEPGWHTTPRVKMALDLQVPVRIDESVVWPNSVAYLDPWYEAMRDARAQLLANRLCEVNERGWKAYTLALGALKQAYLQPLGRLRSAKAAARNDRYYRPSWYDHVIGRELAVEYLRLHQLAERDVQVLAVYFDAIVIESSEPDLYVAAPPPLEVSDQLGKYKPVGSIPTSKARRALFGTARSADPRVWTAPSADVGRLIKTIKANR